MEHRTSNYCQDAGKPGCLIEADPRYVMRFDDIGKPPIHWCAKCGPEAHAIDALIVDALQDIDFHEKFRSAIEKAEKDRPPRC